MGGILSLGLICSCWLVYRLYFKALLNFIGFEQFDVFDEVDGTKTRQFCEGEDDDHAKNWPEIQGWFSRIVL